MPGLKTSVLFVKHSVAMREHYVDSPKRVDPTPLVSSGDADGSFTEPLPPYSWSAAPLGVNHLGPPVHQLWYHLQFHLASVGEEQVKRGHSVCK